MKKIWHPYWKWECYKAGFYTPLSELNITKEQGELQYKSFLSDAHLFEITLRKVIKQWKYSCEHFLTESTRNKIAWLGQASVCYAHKIPCYCRGGFKLLTEKQQVEADAMALKYFEHWKKKNAL